MTVPTIQEAGEAQAYLDMLTKTIVDDVQPLLNTNGGAPHAVAREVFCYVDHLGHLYSGQSDNKRRSIGYLREVLAQCDQGYATLAEQLHEIFRNGPVHEFDPKILTDGTRELSWLGYRGSRSDSVDLPGVGVVSVVHLSPKQLVAGSNRWNLPVSGPCLVGDLLDSVGHLASRVDPAKWNEAAASLCALKRVAEMKFLDGTDHS